MLQHKCLYDLFNIFAHFYAPILNCFHSTPLGRRFSREIGQDMAELNNIYDLVLCCEFETSLDWCQLEEKCKFFVPLKKVEQSLTWACFWSLLYAKDMNDFLNLIIKNYKPQKLLQSLLAILCTMLQHKHQHCYRFLYFYIFGF